MGYGNAAEIFERVMREKKAPKIKLLGDSITHGVGGSGREQNGPPIVESRRESPSGYCWANLFRDHMKERYGATVVNRGCTGVKVEFILSHFSALVEEDDDIVICTVGTNNRHKLFCKAKSRQGKNFCRSFIKRSRRFTLLSHLITMPYEFSYPAMQYENGRLHITCTWRRKTVPYFCLADV